MRYVSRLCNHVGVLKFQVQLLSSFNKTRRNSFVRRMTESASVGNDFQHLNVLFEDLNQHAIENADYFHGKTKNPHNDFRKPFQTIINVLDPLQIALEAVTSCCSRFDINTTCQGNGYRSIIAIVEACLQKILMLSLQIQKSRNKLFFRSYHVYMELDSYTQVLTRLLTVVHLAIVLIDSSEPGCLFPNDNKVDELMDDFEKINRECFYGRSFGFQYSDSIQQSLQVVAVAMAAYGDGYNRHNHSFARALSSMLHSGKYVIDPELRAKRITELTQNENIEFCKAFWSLTEEYGVQHAPLLVCPAMSINTEFVIPRTPLSMKTLDGDVITVELPYETTGVKARLISYVWREGQSQQIGNSSSSFTQLGPKPSQKSRYLMFHCHGGGFVAQSSKSHEMYLRYWAKELKMPILSIDYSLAPDAPFPQALDEIYFAYVWALNNLHSLGTFGEKICFTGDSAGANLVTSLCLKAIESNIRKPDSIVVAYPPYRIQYLPSPSRLLCLMDPLLPLGVLKSCIKAYTGGYKNNKPKPPQRLNSNFYSGDNYNPYDLEFRDTENWFPYNQFQLNHAHSFSESKLNIIKDKISNTNIEIDNDNDTFYSDYPVSTDSSSEYDGDNLSEDMKYFGDKYINCSDTVIDSTASKLNDISKEEETTMLSSLKNQMSTKMQSFTSGVTSYLYASNYLTKYKESKETSQVVLDTTTKIKAKIDSNNVPVESIISNSSQTLQQVTSRKRPFDRKLTKQKSEEKIFSICKTCLHRSSSCLCEVNPKRIDLKNYTRKLNDHYRSSHHHLNNHNRKRSSSFNDCIFLTRDRLERSKSIPVCNTSDNSFVNTTLKSTTSCPNNSKNNEDSISQKDRNNLNLDLDSPSPLLKHKSEVTQVLYNKNYDKCTVVTSEKENLNESFVNINNDIDDLITPTGEVDETKTPMSSEYKDESFIAGANPYLSPYMADEDLLKKLPPITIVACSLDPLFDDSVEFVRKLHKLNHPNAELFVLDQLPHGFLNFQVFSNEARDGCDLLIACIKKSLEMGMRRIDSTITFDMKKK